MNALVLAWLVLSVLLVLPSGFASARHVRSLVTYDPVRYDSLRFMAGALAAAALVLVMARFAVPRRWRSVVAVTAIAPAVALPITSGTVGAVLATLALLGPPLLLGRIVAARLLPGARRDVLWVAAAVVALGALGFLGLVLAASGILRPPIVWLVLVVAAVLGLATGWRDLLVDLRLSRQWLLAPGVPELPNVLLTGAAVSMWWVTLIGALAPEMMTDALTTHLPVALSFARAGSLSGDPQQPLSMQPGAAHLLYALAFVVGPLQTPKLVELAIGVFAAAASGVAARQLGGSRAAWYAVAAFATMPVMAWLAQTAYVDLLATFFAVAAAALILSASVPAWGAAAPIGIALGLGGGVKLTFGYVALGLGLTLALRWLAPANRRAGLRALLVVAGIALLVALPWNAYYLGSNIGFTYAAITRASDQEAASINYMAKFGTGRSLRALARSPYDLTVRAGRFGENARGFVGYLLFALVPLTVFARPRRPFAAILLGSLVT